MLLGDFPIVNQTIGSFFGIHIVILVAKLALAVCKIEALLREEEHVLVHLAVSHLCPYAGEVAALKETLGDGVYSRADSKQNTLARSFGDQSFAELLVCNVSVGEIGRAHVWNP